MHTPETLEDSGVTLDDQIALFRAFLPKEIFLQTVVNARNAVGSPDRVKWPESLRAERVKKLIVFGCRAAAMPQGVK
jgi:hypothetical protein